VCKQASKRASKQRACMPPIVYKRAIERRKKKNKKENSLVFVQMVKLSSDAIVLFITARVIELFY